MDELEKQQMVDAQRAIEEMIRRSEKAQEKFESGTSQSTLLINRIKALQIALSLLSNESSGNIVLNEYTFEDLRRASAPLASLISKSEKVKVKLSQTSWQVAMLTKNLCSLYIVKRLLEETLEKMDAVESLK